MDGKKKIVLFFPVVVIGVISCGKLYLIVDGKVKENYQTVPRFYKEFKCLAITLYSTGLLA